MAAPTCVLELEFRLFLHPKGRGCDWMLQTSGCQPDPGGDRVILCSCSYPHGIAQMFL